VHKTGIAISTLDTGKHNKHSARFGRTWVIALIGIFLAVAYGYYVYRQQQENFINTNYFRVLSEATAKLNENISQLITLTEYNESDPTIRSLFPSFDRFAEFPDFNRLPERLNSLSYQFDGHHLSVLFDDGSEEKTTGPNTTVEVEDILPSPNNGFSLYLLVGENNKVLSSTGDSSTLSIVNVDHISQLIAKSQDIDWAALASDTKGQTKEDSNNLPGFSHYLDLNLTSSEYRLFIYPFQLQSQIEFTDAANGGSGRLYMLGVLPKSMLEAQENQRWNLSLLSLTLVLLMFAWVMLRLFMLSNNQPVGELFYNSTMICSYMLFVMAMALLLAFGEKSIEHNFKLARAESLMKRINYEVDQELVEIEKSLGPYRDYYQGLVVAAKTLDLDKPDSVSNLAKVVLGQNDDNPLQPVTEIGAFSTLTGSYNKNDVDRLAETIKNQKPWPLTSINLFAEGVDVKLGEGVFEESYGPKSGLSSDSKLLSVLLVDNKDGINHMPMFHFIESNKPPTNYDLAHRKYFKNVRDQIGWHGKLGLVSDPRVIAQKQKAECQVCQEGQPMHNFYIQRLRNINNGTRGTTIGLPLFNNNTADDNYVLVADLALTSLTMTELQGQDELLDTTFMVVDRDSGEVLFHLDDDRALIENLFSTGQGSEDISHRIRAGLDGREWSRGYYHGVAGHFSTQKMVVGQWALVAFMPEESLNSYMTNIFLLISITWPCSSSLSHL
jgi:hypothetical protein